MMKMFENNISDNSSIKDNIIIILKESMKFALIGIILITIVGTLLVYMLIEYIGIETEKAAILSGIITAILIVVIDEKKIHTVNKITECNRKILMNMSDKIMKK